ncbi:uncharacterized protein I303_102863 [Kwoniella dejecticola CBS 10117]|uniref:Uncharacterized protein n=1 Tax=Kwoniella dejecticola CBS 10117 TaxID=1296121 RepID=A0A1A6A9X4_9TREE|nr:uncharacterized protein I303_02881 [Kwoniella dejecticola CBS 10117]OBR86862.1 hypothetical protein I303_02881 [Kwoniella dejecticola CBS 10117]
MSPPILESEFAPWPYLPPGSGDQASVCQLPEHRTEPLPHELEGVISHVEKRSRHPHVWDLPHFTAQPDSPEEEDVEPEPRMMNSGFLNEGQLYHTSVFAYRNYYASEILNEVDQALKSVIASDYRRSSDPTERYSTDKRYPLLPPAEIRFSSMPTSRERERIKPKGSRCHRQIQIQRRCHRPAFYIYGSDSEEDLAAKAKPDLQDPAEKTMGVNPVQWNIASNIVTTQPTDVFLRQTLEEFPIDHTGPRHYAMAEDYRPPSFRIIDPDVQPFSRSSSRSSFSSSASGSTFSITNSHERYLMITNSQGDRVESDTNLTVRDQVDASPPIAVAFFPPDWDEMAAHTDKVADAYSEREESERGEAVTKEYNKVAYRGYCLMLDPSRVTCHTCLQMGQKESATLRRIDGQLSGKDGHAVCSRCKPIACEEIRDDSLRNGWSSASDASSSSDGTQQQQREGRAGNLISHPKGLGWLYRKVMSKTQARKSRQNSKGNEVEWDADLPPNRASSTARGRREGWRGALQLLHLA